MATKFSTHRSLLFRGLATLLALAALLPSSPLLAQPARARAELRCEAHGMGPQIDCLVRLQHPDGTPLAGAALTVGASMPSMPLAHSVPRVAARASGKPGEYAASLALEMSGIWAVEIDISAPLRERIVRVVRAQECEKADPCAVPEVRRGSSADKAGAAHKH